LPNSRVVVVGASTSGFLLATELRKLDFEGSITLVSDETQLPYNRTALTKKVLADTSTANEIMLTNESELATLNLEMLLGTKAFALDAKNQTVEAQSADGVAIQLEYESLVIATGMRAKKLGASFPNDLLYLRSLSDTLELAEAAKSISTVCVIGSGILGLELASSLSEMGKRVTVVGDTLASVVTNFGAEICQAIVGNLEKNGVQLIIKTPPKSAIKIDGGYSVEQEDGSRIEAELLVVAIGSDPNTEWLQEAGLASRFGVSADLTGLVSRNIYAVGDVANWSVSPNQPSKYPKTQMSAIYQARAVARRIALGESIEPQAPLFWTELFKQKIQVFGEVADGLESVATSEIGGRVSIHRRGNQVVGVTAMAMPKEFTRTRAKYESEINRAWRS